MPILIPLIDRLGFLSGRKGEFPFCKGSELDSILVHMLPVTGISATSVSQSNNSLLETAGKKKKKGRFWIRLAQTDARK